MILIVVLGCFLAVTTDLNAGGGGIDADTEALLAVARSGAGEESLLIAKPLVSFLPLLACSRRKRPLDEIDQIHLGRMLFH